MAGLTPRSTAVRFGLVKTPAALLLAGLFASTAMLGGCGEDETSARVRSVSNRVTLLTSAGQQLVSVEARRFAELREIRDDLEKLIKEGSGNSASLKLLQARVIEQMANVIAGLAAEKEQEAVLLGARVLSLADVYRVQSAYATAAGKASLADDISRLTADKAAVLGRADDLDKQRAALTSQVAATQKKMDELLARSKTMHEEAATIRTQSAGGTAVSALNAGERAALLNRQADELDRQAAYLSAENARLTPAIIAAESEAAGLREGATRVAAAIASLENRQKLVRDEAAAMGKAMTDTGNDAQAAADALLATHAAQEAGAIRGRVEQAKSGAADTDALRDAVKDASLAGVLSLAESYYTAAGGAAKSLGADVAADQRKSGQNVDISVAQALADLNLLKGRSKQRLAEAMAAVATLTPPVAKQPSYAAQGEAATKDAETAMKDARTAYGELKEKVSGFGGDEARLARLAATLDKLAKGETAPAAPAAPAAKSDGAAAAAAPAGEDITAAIRPVLVKFFEAQGNQDTAAMGAVMFFKDDAERKNFDALGRVGAAQMALDEACKAKFNKSFIAILKADPMMAPVAGMLGAAEAQMEMFKSIKPEQFKITAKGAEAATAQIPGQAGTDASLVKQAGKWLVKVPAELKMQLSMMAGPMGTAMTAGFNAMAADVKSGKIADEKQLIAEMGKMMAAVQGAMMGGGGK